MKILQDPKFGTDYQPGHVFFSYDNDSIVSAGIALFTRSEQTKINVSHCGVIDLNGQAIEADESVGYVARANFKEKYIDDPTKIIFFRELREFNPKNVHELVHYMLAQSGKKYAYGGVVGSALYVLLTKAYKKWPWLRYVPNPLNGSGEVFCSELVAECLREVVGKKGCLAYHPTNVYPQTLFDDDVIWKPWSDGIITKKQSAKKTIV